MAFSKDETSYWNRRLFLCLCRRVPTFFSSLGESPCILTNGLCIGLHITGNSVLGAFVICNSAASNIPEFYKTRSISVVLD